MILIIIYSVIFFLLVYSCSMQMGELSRAPRLFVQQQGLLSVPLCLLFFGGILFILFLILNGIGEVPFFLVAIIVSPVFLGFLSGVTGMEKELAKEEEKKKEEIAIEKEKAAGRSVKAKGLCPWCNSEIRAIITKENSFRRDVCVCPVCNQRVLKCRLCENYTKGGLFWDDEFCPRCE